MRRCRPLAAVARPRGNGPRDDPPAAGVQPSGHAVPRGRAQVAIARPRLLDHAGRGARARDAGTVGAGRAVHSRQPPDRKRSLAKDNYAGDVSTQVYSLNSNANCWRGLRDMAAVLEDLGETDAA